MIDYYTLMQTLKTHGFTSVRYYPNKHSELWVNGDRQLIVPIKDVLPQKYKDLRGWLIS